MRSTVLTLIVALPAAALAQQASSSSSTSASASAQANAHVNVDVPASYSAQARARIRAAFERAHSRNVPDDQMRRRIAEGQAKGAADVQIANAVQNTEARLEASQSLLVRSGRSNPKPEEINNAAMAMERGIAESKIVAAITNPPANASVAASLNALVQANSVGAAGVGSSVVGAVAGSASGGGTAKTGTAGTTGAVSGAVTGAVTGATGAAGVTGAVAGSVTGAIPKKP